MAKKKSVMDLELIGGIYIVERFSDGTERREEIDGKTVLETLLVLIRKAVDDELKE